MEGAEGRLLVATGIKLSANCVPPALPAPISPPAPFEKKLKKVAD
jgi:hypothetical protein